MHFIGSALLESLSLWERWQRVSADGEGKPGTKEPLRSDKQYLCQRETSAAPVLLRQRPCPLRRSRASSPKGRAFYLLTTQAPPLTGWAV